MSETQQQDLSIVMSNTEDPITIVTDKHPVPELDDGLVDADLQPHPVRAFVQSSAPYIAAQGFERYHGALKNLIPVRRKALKVGDIGVDQVGIFSFVFSTWLSKLMYKAHRKCLAIEDIPKGSPKDSCDLNVQRLEMLWQEELREHGPSGASLPRAVWRFIRTRIVVDWLLFTICAILGCLTPMVFMRKLLEFAENPVENLPTGVIWAFLLMFCEFFRIFFFSWRWALAFRTAVRLRAACLGLLYRKIIRLNNFEEQHMGQLINIFASDSQRIFNMILFGPMIVGGPMVLVCGVLYVLTVLGPWALTGILVFIAFYPLQYIISRACGSLREKTVQVSDKRVSLMSEILSHIKIVKMNAWEKCFEEHIYSLRQKEHQFVEKSAISSGFGVSLAPTVPIISAVVTFLAHTASGNSLIAAQVFSVQAIFLGCSHNAVRALKSGLTTTYNAIVGLKKLQRCLLINEIQPRIQRPIDRAQAISIGGATFSCGTDWNPLVKGFEKRNTERTIGHIKKSDLKEEIEERENLNKTDFEMNGSEPVLRGINFSVSKGHMVGVCGPVGSGKTSLLLAILGQMRLLNGQLGRDGTCAYVSQQAWVVNGTLRDNILFGEAFVPRRYYSAINSCLLNDDLNLLPGGDLTEIGERGLNLSGGQKQRVALARALYSNKDIFLLDDPLSAVDVSVGASIFENYFQRELKNKTVVLVSHQLQYLSQCDEIYFMKNGLIVERGSHEELLRLDGEYASMFMLTSQELPSSDNCPPQNESNCPENKKIVFSVAKDEAISGIVKTGGEKLTVDEPTSYGSLKADTYFRYITAAGGHMLAFLVFIVFLANVGSTAFSSWWLATWIKAGAGSPISEKNTTSNSTNLAENPDFAYYQIVYGSTIGLILLTCGLRCFVFTKATIRASSALHKQLFQKIIYSPMLFFESNPIGRMQNLFSREIDEVDCQLPNTVENTIQNLWILAFSILFICIVFPWFFVAFIPLSIIYYFVSKIFRKGIRDLKRLENHTQAPIFNNLVETLQGLNTIHAFNKEGDYIQRFFQLYDENSTCCYLWNVGMRWMAVRVDLIAAVTTSITAFLVVVLRGTVAPAMAGLALAYSWHISGVLQYTTRLISETEVRFISVERILAYMDGAVKEGKENCSKPPSGWPNQGHICFQNVSLSYRKNLSNALSNVSFNILSGEKIGVVGRTGSGKSSLTVALFRLVELSSGCIKLDGLDISDISLTVLRNKISIIPQEPVLFTGTLRFNLDPENKFSDQEVWEVLAKCQLLERVRALPLKLSTVISGSSGLSVGESQLLCLARALLLKNKVLVMDEATASIDPETEDAVQSTLQKQFENCTVLIIAHRLSTVANCDRILVMHESKVVEFNSPTELLANRNSAFSRMMATREAHLLGSAQFLGK